MLERIHVLTLRARVRSYGLKLVNALELFDFLNEMFKLKRSKPSHCPVIVAVMMALIPSVLHFPAGKGPPLLGLMFTLATPLTRHVNPYTPRAYV